LFIPRFYESKNDIPLGMSFKTPPLFDHYGDGDKDVEVFIEEKGINIQPSNEGEIFYQEKHDQDKEPSIDIHEVISCQQLADVIKANKGEVDKQPTLAFLSHVLATNIQPDVISCKAKQVFFYRPRKFYHLFYDPVREYKELHFLHVLKPPSFIFPSALEGELKNVIVLLSQFHYLYLISHRVNKFSVRRLLDWLWWKSTFT
jgi:hypothetical protein